MHRVLPFLLVACGSSTKPSPNPANTAPAPAPMASGLSSNLLVERELRDVETGAQHRVWILPGRDSSIDTNDPCCGLSYDGNRYEDSLASCSPSAQDHTCAPGTTGVYPGLAEDVVCGARRRCVPLPEVRILVHDGTSVEAHDAEESAIPIGKVAHQPIHIGREGFVTVTIAGRTERIAVDYGSRYTIEVRGDRIARITRDERPTGG